ncbi:MAG: lytic transglycosylase domain-containing protein [Treponema sp.]|nr:lytic transglycosylase domain-containing protein [Treponema sp.]
MAKKLSPEKAYFAYFYAARLYDKAGRYPAQTVSRFHSALEATKDPMQFDNCLWYLLNFQLRTSTDDIISTLTKYGSKINEPEYFDDFFESLSILLLSSQKWQDFYKIWKQTDSNFSDYTEGKFAYISGRLIEEGLAQGDAGLKTRQAVDAFARVLNSNSSLYYKVCAMERLDLTAPELIESYLLRQNEPNKNTEDEKSATEEHGFDSEAQVLLEGYAGFGFPERIYPEWLANRKNLTVEDSIKACRFLSQCAESRKDNTYNVQSLRIAARSLEMSSGNTPKELMTFAFPQIYKFIIDEASKEFEVSNYLMYALVRSESFFDAGVTSKAGANGLTQLMESTADDEARKLKINENGGYDIFDPETNVRMGTHYLSSLIGRTDGKNKLLALYAYNAGLTNVRNWGKRFRNDWLATGKAFHKPVGISMDLFLESLPFAETREYGRKVVSAAAMYAYLYDNKLPGETVREIMYE